MSISLFDTDETFKSSLSPLLEMGAYEALWLQTGATVKQIADKFRNDKTLLPSDLVETSEAKKCAMLVLEEFKKNNVKNFGVRINHAGDYPKKIRDARNPVELLYYQGLWELTEQKCIAIVGSRKASDEGLRRAARLAREFAKKGVVVVSGLAEGIDQAAHRAAIEVGGKTISVIGTPLNEVYPKIHADLQADIAKNHLLISQVPVLRYGTQDYRINRNFFPERNATMSALTDATVIVEASETSGTLTQARAALFQKRKLFILNSCFENKDINWPAKFEKKGAIRVRDFEDIWKELGEGEINQN